MAFILGISAFYHDSAAALVKDGEIVAAAQEERFSRKKHDPGFPTQAIRWVLADAGLNLTQVDHIVFYDKPFLKFERLLETYIQRSPKGLRSFAMAMPIWLREKLFLKSLLGKQLREQIDAQFRVTDSILFSEHHLSHAASAFYPSPYEEAVVLTLDGVGEWATTTVACGRGHDLKIDREIHWPHSLGLLYSAFTYYTGFRVNSGEYKLMGLAPYGTPKYKDKILNHLIDVKEDGSFWMDQRYFDYCTGLTMTSPAFDELFSRPARKPEEEQLTQFHMDIAASIQSVLEEILILMTRSLAQTYQGIPNLCLAGGVALNCVANGKILRDGAFQNVWVQPAAGDAGGSLGAALAVWHKELGQSRKPQIGDSMRGSYLGPVYSQSEVEEGLTQAGAVYQSLSDEEMIEAGAQALADGMAVGWFQGRMEFGPRALGGRSILGDPRSASMQKTLNLKVKYRESFRPFAPSVLAEKVADWFELEEDSPYMLLVADVRQDKRRVMSAEEEALFGIDKLNISRSEIPAVTHVDYSARVQTVHADTNPLYHKLISSFEKLTGCPVVVNTSFNVRGEPIVCTPEDAFRCFMGTEIEMLIVGRCVLRKEEQDPALKQDYKDKFDLD